MICRCVDLVQRCTAIDQRLYSLSDSCSSRNSACSRRVQVLMLSLGIARINSQAVISFPRLERAYRDAKITRYPDDRGYFDSWSSLAVVNFPNPSAGSAEPSQRPVEWVDNQQKKQALSITSLPNLHGWTQLFK
jgi:hypothetical protein